VLTPAEWAVLDLVRHGLSRREIAARRGTSLDAVKFHVENISGKLGVAGMADLRHWPGFPARSPLAERKEPSMNQTTAPAVQLGPLGQVSLYAKDVSRVETFYRDTLGLPHVFTFGELAFFDLGGTRLYVHAVGEKEWRPGSVLYFLVDDIRSAYDALGTRGIKFSGAPHMIFEDDSTHVQEWMAFFEDSEGNMLALMSRVTPAATD
jgi:catechol 2,3-dioxygenase-like lactoylglutathione lyase family enzyme